MTTTIALMGLLALQSPEAAHATAPGERASETQAAGSGNAHSALDPTQAPAPGTAPKRGAGMLATGAFLSPVGALLVISAAVSYAGQARCEREEQGECWDGLAGAIQMPIGVVALAVGIPLLGAGVHRRRVWRAWQREHGLVMRPRFGRSSHAWILGLDLRF